MANYIDTFVITNNVNSIIMYHLELSVVCKIIQDFQVKKIR